MPKQIARDFGGWRDPRIPTQWSGRKAYVKYAMACIEYMGDIVEHWVTFQEPQRELLLFRVTKNIYIRVGHD